MTAAPGGGLRCANCRREWPPKVFGCLVALLLGVVVALALLAYERDARDARLAAQTLIPTHRSLALADHLQAIAGDIPSGDGARYSLLNVVEALRARRSCRVECFYEDDGSRLVLVYDAASDELTIAGGMPDELPEGLR